MKKRVMIIDSQDLVRAAIERYFGDSETYAVYEKTVPVSGLRRDLHSWPAEIVIVDPGSSTCKWPDVIKEIQTFSPTSRIVVLAMQFERSSIEQLLTSGVMALLTKTDTMREILAAIDAVANGKTFLSPAVTSELFSDRRAAANRDRNPSLTNRQEEVLRLMAGGKTTRQVATALGVSVKTIDTHRVMLMNRLGISSLSGLVKYALRNGYTDLE